MVDFFITPCWDKISACLSFMHSQIIQPIAKYFGELFSARHPGRFMSKKVPISEPRFAYIKINVKGTQPIFERMFPNIRALLN